MTNNTYRQFCVDFAQRYSLEEAIVFECMNSILDDATHTSVKDVNLKIDRIWHEVDVAIIQQQLEFWDLIKIESILQLLRSNGIIIIGSAQLNLSSRFKYSFLMSKQDIEEVLVQPARTPMTAPPKQIDNSAPFIFDDQSTAIIADNWRPAEDTYKRLNWDKITQVFAENQLISFIGYHQTKKTELIAWQWDNKFYYWCKKAWSNFEIQQRKIDNLPKPIATDWQPSELFFQNLATTKIPKEFATAQLNTFIMYWHERGDARPSWDKKFLDHVQHQWTSHNSKTNLQETSLHDKINNASWIFN